MSKCDYCGAKHQTSSIWCSPDCQLAAIYSDFAAKQRPIGAEFAAALAKKHEELYEE